MNKCKNCSKSEPEVRFGVLAETGQVDAMCMRCRFDKIDTKHSSLRGIRADMEEVGIPVSKGIPARRLKTTRAASPEDGSADTQIIPDSEE